MAVTGAGGGAGAEVGPTATAGLAELGPKVVAVVVAVVAAMVPVAVTFET